MPMSTSNRNERSRRDERGRAKDHLDDYVRAFERAYGDRGCADPADFLPPPDHPLHAAVLSELVRVDMEFGWTCGRPKELGEYLRIFPQVAEDRDSLKGIAFEEFRLRHDAGEEPTPEEYLARYGVRLDAEVRRLRPAPSPYRGGGSARSTRGESMPELKMFGARPPRPLPALPAVGDEFLGFRLVGELGHGSFGKVFLARQKDLADRTVVLKVTADGPDEAQTLAQLRHDNIVPIYSRHYSGALRAVCMPYLGAVTLRDVFNDLRTQGSLPDSGQGLLSSLAKSSVLKASRAGADSASAAQPESATVTASQVQARSWPGSWWRRQREDGAPASDAANPPTELGAATVRPSMVPPMPDAALTPVAASPVGALSYVEAVVWMAARLAEGLAHAHARGILHRDMKPANILLADDGRPMLLDFNLAEDLKLKPDGDPGAIGGTLPYMAPEHLDAFHGGSRPVDARSDLYGLGVILFELLTGRPPFPQRDGVRAEMIRAMVVDRQATPPPPLRPWNPAVSHAIESIVHRCLAAEPANRYQSANELAEDLRRQLDHQPLLHAPEPSRRDASANGSAATESG